MIAACPKCSARYRVDEAKIGAEGVRLRCAKCEAVFRVRAPQPTTPVEAPAQAAAPQPSAQAAAAPPPAAPQQSMAPPPQATAPEAPAPAPPPPTPQLDSQRLVLIADPEVSRGQNTVAMLEAWGLQTVLVHDGVEAMMAIQRDLPRAVVLDAALPKMYGFQICEVIKRNESLRGTGVVLVGAINDQDRYRRPATDTYGADVYLDQPDLPAGLHDILTGFGMSLGAAAASTPAAAPVAPPPQAAAPIAPPPQAAAPVAAPPQAAVPSAPVPSPESQAAPAPPAPGADPELEEGRAQAERLARIIVSDIVLYHPEKFDQAIKSGNVVEALDQGIEEGRALFRQRIDERVREEKDYIIEELLRVARERGMQ